MKQQPLEFKEQVEQVSVDMWAGFPKVIAEVFPNAAVVIDRFHVIKLVNQRLNKIRQILGIKAKGSRFILLKTSSDLSESETEKLEQILAQSACLRIAYWMKEELREVYEINQTVQTGIIRMNKWLATAIVFYDKVARTICTHLEEICNYFISRTTSGVMEEINNKAKLVMRQGYGFTNFESFRARFLGSFSD